MVRFGRCGFSSTVTLKGPGAIVILRRGDFASGPAGNVAAVPERSGP